MQCYFACVDILIVRNAGNKIQIQAISCTFLQIGTHRALTQQYHTHPKNTSNTGTIQKSNHFRRSTTTAGFSSVSIAPQTTPMQKDSNSNSDHLQCRVVKNLFPSSAFEDNHLRWSIIPQYKYYSLSPKGITNLKPCERKLINTHNKLIALSQRFTETNDKALVSPRQIL